MDGPRQPLLDPSRNHGDGNPTITIGSFEGILRAYMINQCSLEPSAPSLENLEQDIGARKKKLARKIYFFITCHLTIFAIIACLFVYV